MTAQTNSAISYCVGDADARPWGKWEVIAVGEGYICKEITVLSGAILSLQSHQHRSEHWVVLSGVAEVTLNEDTFTLSKNETVFVPSGVKHRIANPDTLDLVFVEIQVGKVLDENDIERFEDRYGRSC